MNRNHFDFDTRAREARAHAARVMWTTLRERLFAPNAKAGRG